MKKTDKMKMEREHTKSKKGQKKIVADHEGEFGEAYYPALKKMEAKLPKYEKPDKSKHNKGKNKAHEKKESKEVERKEHIKKKR